MFIFIIVVYIIFISLLMESITIINIKFMPIILLIILMVALFILLERKVLAGVQRRREPNIMSVFGLLQPRADALKLIFKETIISGQWYYLKKKLS